jgi:very-short-patch-repair endonuclease
MSLDNKYELRKIAKYLARKMRSNPTSAEKKFWEYIRDRKFMNIKFRRQHPFYFDYLGKETFYIVDFYSSEEKIVIEIDGKIHNFTKQKDKERTDILNLLGLRVIRFKNDEVENNIEEVLKKLELFINRNDN